MFHFPTFPPHTLYIQVQVTRHHSCWVSPFGHPRITARLTAPRGLSQPPTSFIGSWCQGIHRTLLKTYKQRCSRPLCNSQTTHTPPCSRHPQTPRNFHPSADRTSHDSLHKLSCLERNTHVFSQDPTVHRYNSFGHRHCRRHDERMSCQCSTREHRRMTYASETVSVAGSSADCSAVHPSEEAP